MAEAVIGMVGVASTRPKGLDDAEPSRGQRHPPFKASGLTDLARGVDRLGEQGPIESRGETGTRT